MVVVFALTSASESIGGWLSSRSGCLGEMPYSRETVERMARVSLPENAGDLIVETSGLQDCEIFLSFKIHPDDLDNFLRSTFVETPLRRERPPSYFDHVPPSLAWTLKDVDTHLIGEGERNGERQYIAVDTKALLVYTVYFATFLP